MQPWLPSAFGVLLATIFPEPTLPASAPVAELCAVLPPFPDNYQLLPCCGLSVEPGCHCDARSVRLNERAAAAAQALEEGSPCGAASAEVWDFIDAVAERILWKGMLFAENREEEEHLLRDPAASYEECPGALLLALLGCSARAEAVRDVELSDSWLEAFLAWNTLPWTDPLVWHNLQDPTLRTALVRTLAAGKVLRGAVVRPSEVCNKALAIMLRLLDNAAGMSLTVGSVGYGGMEAVETTTCFQVLTTYRHLLDETPDCPGILLFGHYFLARQQWDLRPDLGAWHEAEARMLAEKLYSEGEIYGLFAGVANFLHDGLEVQKRWMTQAAVEPPSFVSPEVSPGLRPLTIWERSLTPVFSESQKDPVLERLFGIVGVTNRFFVEVGTQAGDQCNTRYFRVRYGFHGLMLDDNFQNTMVNQKRHFITPGNIAGIFRDNHVPMDFDLLSLDTDGNEWLLWLSLQEEGFSPRVVVLEYGERLPFMEDVIVRYTTFPVHRLCLTNLESFPSLSGGSISSILKLGLSWGYHLVHLVASGTSDLVFVRNDVLEQNSLAFPAQDDPAGLCALAAYQSGETGSNCQREWPEKQRPAQELLTTAEQALAGDFKLRSDSWTPERLKKAFC